MIKPLRGPVKMPKEEPQTFDPPAASRRGAYGTANPIEQPRDGSRLFYFKGQSNIINDERLNRVESGFPKQRNGVPVKPSGNYQLLHKSAINPDTGTLNPLTSVQAYGNIAPRAVSGAISAVATTSSVTLHWDGTNSSQPIVMQRADGASSTVTPRSIQITGLSPSTQYGIAPYHATQQQKMGFGPGDSGSPQILLSPSAPSATTAQAVHRQQLYQSEPIYSGVVYFTTPAAGSSTSQLTTKAGSAIPVVRANGVQFQ